MKKVTQLSLTIILMVALNARCAYAQELGFQICGSKLPIQEANLDVLINDYSNSKAAIDLIIPIQFTVFREDVCDNDKYDITVAQIKNVIDEINNAKYFQAYPLSIAKFNLVGVKFVIDPNLATIPDATIPPAAFSKDQLLFDNTPKNMAIQVCIVKTERSYAKFPTMSPSNLIVLSKYKIDDKINTFKLELAHELGHYFGLLHTHEQTENKATGTNTSEFADRSNSWAAGDKVYETFADPRADQCTYSICDDGQTLATATNNIGCSELDLNPNLNALVRKYNPNMFNIMGYYYPAYRCGGNSNPKNIHNTQFHFSNTQLNTMYSVLNKKTGTRFFLIDKPATGFTVTDFHAGKILRAQCANAPFSEPVIAKNVSIAVAGNTIPFTSTTNTCGRYYGQNSILVPNEGKQVNVKICLATMRAMFLIFR